VTFSIVGHDPEAGTLGVGIASRSFGVGRDCAWARAGVGAIATQSFTDVAYGPLGLELLAAGRSPELALAGLVEADPRARFRQAGVVAANGASTAHTGDQCVPAAGHRVGAGFAAQANMAVSERVWEELADAFAATTGTLAARLLAALDAGRAAGGDWRGLRSAALLVVGEPSPRPWESPLVDVRVDDHDDPLGELRRLLRLEEWFTRLGSIGPGSSVEEEVEAALAAGAEEPDPTWAALYAAAAGGDVQAARAQFERLVKREPRYAEIARRLPGVAGVVGLEAVE
jgi:uncharacterized Ntn-hydrolase superfamily protein